MAQNYENSIKIGITLQPKEEVKSELKSILEYLQKDNNIDLNFNTQNLEKSLKNLNNIIANLGNAINKNLDFSQINTKDLTSNLNKSVSSVNFDTLQTSLMEQFTEEAGLKAGEKVNDAFIKAIKKHWASGEIQNILVDALALNDKNILDMEKELTKTFKMDEIEKYSNFLKEINVLTDELKVKGQVISFKNIELSNDEIKDVKKKFGKMISINDINGIGIDKVMDEWTDSAKKFGLTLDGVIQDKISDLANIVAKYRDIKKNGVSTQSILSSNDEEQQVSKITKAYYDLIEALDILDKQKGAIDTSLINSNSEIQEINKVEQAIEGLGETTKKSLNIDSTLNSFGTLEKRAEEIRSSVDSLAKVKYNIGDDGNLSSAAISYTDNMGKAVTETIAWKNVVDDTGKTVERVFGVTNISITDNIEKIKQAQITLKNTDYTTSQKESYKILSDLLKEEYTLKTKLISAEGEYKQKLEERLVEVNLLRNAQKEDISSNKLTNIARENDLINQQRQLQEQLNQVKAKNNDSYQQEQQAVQALIQKQIKLLEIKKQGVIAKDNQADTSAIDEAIAKYKQLNNVSLSELRSQIAYINAEMKASSGTADTFMSKIGKSLNNIGVYVDAGDVFRTIMNCAKEAVQYVVDVENAMIDLTRVVDMSDTQAKTFQDSMHNLSLELASTNADTISTVATFSKLGYSLQDATNLGEIVTKYNSAADINDINDATLSLIATLKGYNLDAKDAESVTNDINEVTNKYAVTATDLNEILKRSSATMYTFGNSLQQNIALGTVANEIIQDSAKVGNALKSIGARITTNSNALKELEAMGISIEDINGNLKSTYQLFEEMSPKIQAMKGEELARVANNLFGKEQMSVALSIVQNIDKLDKVMETLKDTTGSVNNEFDRYLNSTDAKVKQLKENMGGLYSQFVNSDMTKGTVDGLNAVVSTINNVISKIGALSTTLGAVMTVLTVFNKEFTKTFNSYRPEVFNDAVNKLKSLSTGYSDTITKIKENIVAQQNATNTLSMTKGEYVSARTSLLGYQTQLVLATASQKALAVSAQALSIAINAGIGIGIGLIVQGLYNWANASEIAKQKNEELLSSIQQTKSDVSTMSELESQFKSISKALQSGTLTDTESIQKKSELKSIYDQLIQASPQLEGALSLENGQYEDNINLIEQAIELKKQQLKLDTEKYITNNDVNDKGIQKQIDKIKELQESIKGFASKSLMTDDELINSGNMTILGKMLGSGDDRRKYFEQLKNESKQELIDLQNDLQTELSKINSAEKLGIKLGVSEESKNNISQAISDISKILNTESQSLNNNTDSIKLNEEAVRLLKQAQSELSSTGIITNDTLDKLNAVCPELGINATNASDILGEMGDSIDGLGDSANDAQSDLEELAKTFNSLSSTNSDIDSVIEDLQKLGGITESTYGKIIDNPEILKALSAEGDTIANLTALQEENRKAMQARIQQAVDTANGVSSAQQTEADSKINSDNQKLQSDANVNSQIRQNATDTTNSNSQNYSTDDSNFSKIQSSKSQNDASFHDNWRKNTEDSVNELGDMYKLDFSNFDNVTQAKNALLSKFKNNLESMGGVFKGASTGMSRMANAITAPWNQATGISEGLAESMDSLFGTDSLNALNQYKEGLIQIGGMFDSAGNKKIDTSKVDAPEIKKANSTPAMVKGSTSSGSGSKGTKGKSDAEKAQEEAEKYAEKIKELQSNIDIDRYFDLNQALESVNNEMTALKTEQSQLMGMDYQSSLIKEIGLLESKKSALADINDEQKREAEELKNYLSQYGFYFDANGKLINSQQRLLEIQKATNAMGGNTEEELKKKQEWVDWVEELQDKTESYVDLVNSKIPDVTNQWNEVGNSIRKAQLSMIESIRDKLVDAIKKDAEKEVEKLKQEVEDAQEDAKKALEDEKEAKVNILDTRIEKLKKELEDLDNEDTDKRAKLAKLKEELSKWQKDDSVFSKKKISDLQEQIASLEKEIKKDDINNQIDDLEEEKKTTEDYYSEKLDKLKEQQKAELEEKQKALDEMLSDESAYHKADLLLKEKNMTEITRLLSSYSENFKEIGSLLGTNFAEALNQEIKSAMDSLDAVMNQTISTDGNSNNTSSNSLSNNTSNGKNNHIWVEDGAKTQIYTDSTGTKSKGSLWSNGIASADKLVQGERKNGFYEVFDLNGNSLGWVDARKIRKWNNNIAQFASGGRTPSNIDGGALSILHSGEAILNANDTQKLDDIYNFVTVSASLLDRLESYMGLSNTVHETIMPTPDYNRILDGNTTTNDNSRNVTIENEINITNNTKNDSYFNAHSLEKMFKNQISRFGGNKLK